MLTFEQSRAGHNDALTLCTLSDVPSRLAMERSCWQEEAQLHEFDSYGRTLDAARKEVIAAAARAPSAPVPTTYDTVYEPDHRDADWAGLVSKAALNRRKHIPTKTVLQHDPEAGITTEPGVTSYGVRFDTRRICKPAEKDEARLLAGLDVNTGDRYETTYRTQTRGTPTAAELYFESKRALGKRRVPTPALTRPACSPNGTTDSYMESLPSPPAEDDGQLVGYRANIGSKSLLSGIGSKLVSSGITRYSWSMEEISLPAGFTPGGLGGAAGGVNPEEMKAKQEQMAEMEERRKAMIAKILTPEARERLARIAIVKADKAKAIEDMLLGAATSGRLAAKVTEEQLIQMLEQVSNQTKKGLTKVTIQRRNYLDDEDDDNDDDLL